MDTPAEALVDRTTAPPWQLRVVRPPAMEESAWRSALIRLVEMY